MGSVQTFSGGFLVGGLGWEEGDMLGEFFIEEFVMGEENFYEGSAGFSSIIKKNIEKINRKRFFQLEVRSSIKT